MCNCNGYKKMDEEDDDCCNCCCCGCLCKCIRNTLCCCCKCGLCLFKFLCSILSCVGILLVLYLIMMICTDEYLRGAVWRDCPFEFEGFNPDDFINQHPVENSYSCDPTGYCTGVKTVYMYAHGGSGFLGAVLYEVETAGGRAIVQGQEALPIDTRLYNEENYYLSESRINEINLEYSFNYNVETHGTQPAFSIDFTDLKFTSVMAGFWDFMPIGPGGSFGVAESFTYIDSTVIPEGDFTEYVCHV